MATRILAWGLRGWALAHGVAAVLWILSPYGTGTIGGGSLPKWVYRALSSLLGGVFTGPFVSADLADPGVGRLLANLSGRLTGYQGRPVRGAFGDINLGWTVQFSSLTWMQGAGWVALHVAPLLVRGVLWWMLADVLAQAGTSVIFTSRNAGRLIVAGLVVMIGAPVLSVLTWWFGSWVASSSELAGRIRVQAYSWDQLPWTVIAAGFAVVVLGQVWRRGAGMETELGGLV